MSLTPHVLSPLLEEDPRYRLEAYLFVYNALGYAQNVLKMGPGAEEKPSKEHHLTGQQLCEAIRRYALQQYGYLAKVVLNSWGLYSTSDFGEVVYNLIRVGVMRKSAHDKRTDFDDQYEFDVVFEQEFQIQYPE
jgi:uncharacterized repeat protein (TIGR04138 family)